MLIFFRAMNMEALLATPGKRKLITPRNRKQLQNIKYGLDRLQRPEDDFQLVQVESFVHPEFYPDTRIHKGKLYVTVRLPEMDEHISKLLSQKQRVEFGYDMMW